MRLISLAVCNGNNGGDNAIILCQETDIGSVFLKSTGKEMCLFIARELAHHCKSLVLSSLQYKDFYGHVYKEPNNLCVIAITDHDYPHRAAHGVVRNVLDEFKNNFSENDWIKSNDYGIKFPYLSKLLQEYKEPKQDKIDEIEKEIQNAKQIVVQSIEKVLENMDKLDELVQKSNDLSESSKIFYKKSKKMNRCCNIL